VLIFNPNGDEVKSFRYQFLVDGIAWLPDSTGMFLQCRSQETNFRSQIKFQPYPSGALQNITNDLNEYRNISVTNDGRSLATTEEQKSLAVYLGNTPATWPGEIRLNSSPLTSGQAEGGWLQWSLDGKIFFDDEDFHSFQMNPNGASRERVPDRDTNAVYGLSCGSQATVFATLRDNMLNLFRQDRTSGEIKQLTFEHDAERPTCTRDGKTVYFDNNLDGPTVKRVLTNGGKPEVVAANSENPSLSPDEKRIAFFQFSSAHKVQIVIQDVGGSGNKTFLSSEQVVRGPQWAPDGRALILDKRTGAGSNLFYQPLDGSKPTQLTHFDSEPLWISAYSISPDGKQIAITRAHVNDSDLVMFSNFR
jgi:hypothetical protein